MMTFEEYKALVGDKLAGLTPAQIEALYKRDTTFAAFAIKTWLASRRERRKECGKMAPTA